MEKITTIMLSLVVLAFFISAYFYPQMPERMATHWNERGEIDGYMHKFWGLLLMPFITLGMIGLFFVLPKIDPLKKNYDKFRSYYNGLILVIIGFLFYIHLVSIAANLGFVFNMTYFIMPPIALLFLFIGFMLPKAKRNWFVGIRTPWTLSSDRVWGKTNRLGGRLFIVLGAYLIIMLLFYDLVLEHFFWIIIGPIILLTLFLFVYSYYEYSKEGKK